LGAGRFSWRAWRSLRLGVGKWEKIREKDQGEIPGEEMQKSQTNRKRANHKRGAVHKRAAPFSYGGDYGDGEEEEVIGFASSSLIASSV